MGLWNLVPPAWQRCLLSERQVIDRIESDLQLFEVAGKQVIPKKIDIFRALDTAPAHVRVVILGQDPYPTPSHATGLAFSVPSGTKPLPPTLRNILKELASDVGATKCEDGDLSLWKEQGVLLLNRTLTTEAGVSNAHANLGWQTIVQAIIRCVNRENPDVVAILWGKQAQELASFFNPQWIISTAHPSPLSAHRGFFGSHPFSNANALLREQGKDPIRW